MRSAVSAVVCAVLAGAAGRLPAQAPEPLLVRPVTVTPVAPRFATNQQAVFQITDAELRRVGGAANLVARLFPGTKDQLMGRALERDSCVEFYSVLVRVHFLPAASVTLGTLHDGFLELPVSEGYWRDSPWVLVWEPAPASGVLRPDERLRMSKSARAAYFARAYEFVVKAPPKTRDTLKAAADLLALYRKQSGAGVANALVSVPALPCRTTVQVAGAAGDTSAVAFAPCSSTASGGLEAPAPPP